MRWEWFHDAIVPLCVVTFVMFAYQYFRINPERRVLNPQFGLMVSTIVLMIGAVYASREALALILFTLTLLLFGLSIYLARKLPPPRI